MAAKTEARGAAKGTAEFRKTADARMLAIGANQPGATNPLAVYFCARTVEAGNAGAPNKRDASRSGAIDEQFVQDGATHAKRSSPRKSCGRRGTFIRETNSGKRSGRCGIEIDAEIALAPPLLQAASPLRKLYRLGCAGIDERDAKALRPRGDGGRQSCGAASDDQHVRLDCVIQIALPSEENQFRAEARTHCGQNAQGARRRAPMLVNILQN